MTTLNNCVIISSMKQDLSEEVLWKERVELEKVEKTEDSFIPAKLAEPTKEEDVLVRIIL